MIDEALRETGTVQSRLRDLPSRVVVYLMLAAGLFPETGYPGVWRKLTGALVGLPVAAPSASALAQARRRVGSKPLRWLFDLLKGPPVDVRAPGTRWRGLLVTALDGTMSTHSSATTSPGQRTPAPAVTLRPAYTRPPHTYSDAPCTRRIRSRGDGTDSVDHMNSGTSPARRPDEAETEAETEPMGASRIRSEAEEAAEEEAEAGTTRPVSEFTMAFVSSPRGARLARRLVSQRLDAWRHPFGGRVNDTLTLITAELAANVGAP
ncbi:hypothetical protein SCWH03_41320 [Streptomyces pacificus]|uniref:Transposase IS4 N-terminal domain-containing protein n=2 Tax=Streptomyces pacificus TaxID=2705029 RepID=A0A6A0AYG6_9ACTN|nr:hypothetical protein SCWH03_41320 [Streptomyces pacificus]